MLTALVAAFTTLMIFGDVAAGRVPLWFVLVGILVLAMAVVAVHRVLRWEDYAVDHDIQFVPEPSRRAEAEEEARLDAIEAGRLPAGRQKKAWWE